MKVRRYFILFKNIEYKHKTLILALIFYESHISHRQWKFFYSLQMAMLDECFKEIVDREIIEG